MTKETLEFIEVNSSSLPTNVATALEKFRKAEAEYKAAKENFETLFISKARATKQLPEGKKLVFGYKFGKLVVAAVELKSESKASSKPKFSF